MYWINYGPKSNYIYNIMTEKKEIIKEKKKSHNLKYSKKSKYRS